MRQVVQEVLHELHTVVLLALVALLLHQVLVRIKEELVVQVVVLAHTKVEALARIREAVADRHTEAVVVHASVGEAVAVMVEEVVAEEEAVVHSINILTRLAL